MKIRLTSVELEEYKTIAECLRNKGFISNFEIVGEENDPTNAMRTITIRDLDTLSKPSKEPLSFDCTLAKFAEQLDVPLWKAMEFGKYFTPSMVSEFDIIKALDKVDYHSDDGSIGINQDKEKLCLGEILSGINIEKIAKCVHNLITKGQDEKI